VQARPVAGGPRRTAEASVSSLVDAARKGDRRAFEQLVRSTWARTYTLAYRLTGNLDDAHDVAQEAYLRAMRAMPRFRGEARFSTWLHRVTANCASDHLARTLRSRHARLDPDWADSEDHRSHGGRGDQDAEALATSVDQRALLSGALMRLPAPLRQVVVLRDIYDLPHKAIAVEVGISEAVAKVRLQRARRRLREDLGFLLSRQGEGTTWTRTRVLVRDDDAVAS